MGRINVYLPDELLERVRDAQLNVSAVTQQALASELDRRRTDLWLQAVSALPSAGIDHDAAISALDSGRADFGN